LKRSVLLYWIIIKTIVKTAAIAVKSFSNTDDFPMLLIFIVISEILFGIYIAVKKNISGLKYNLLALFFGFESALVVFKLWYVGYQHNVAASLTNMLLTGSVLDLILNAVLLAIIFSNRKYVLVEKNVEAEESQLPSA